jgi:hypothetical protein
MELVSWLGAAVAETGTVWEPKGRKLSVIGGLEAANKQRQ